MARTQTLENLRSRARRYADMRNANQFVTDDTVDDIINECIDDYYDLLVAVRGQEYFLTDTTFSVTAGTASYTLPESLYQLSTVSLEWGNQQNELVKPIDNNRDITTFDNLQTWDRFTRKGYRLTGLQDGTQTLTFHPTPATSVTARLRYVPAFSPLEDDEDVIASFNGFDTLVALDAAMRLRVIGDLPTANLEKLFAAKRQQVMEMATERVQDEPNQVGDVDPIGPGDDGWGRRYARGFSE